MGKVRESNGKAMGKQCGNAMGKGLFPESGKSLWENEDDPADVDVKATIGPQNV